MKNSGRYTISSNEDYEPKSNEKVLKNKLGITSLEEMQKLEKQELERTESELIEIYDNQHQFTAEDICDIHQLWLGDIYTFAGNYRSTNLSKGNFLFASSSQIPSLMEKLERNFLAKYTPCHYQNINELSFALGIVHIELILIHPFREGNGRTARLLADLMAIQANKPPLNYSSIDQTKNVTGFERYILAIHAGVAGNYQPIQEIFKVIVEQSIA